MFLAAASARGSIGLGYGACVQVFSVQESPQA